jgi:putative ABC transport system permease protein
MVPLWLAQRMLRMEGRVTTYAIAVDRLDNLEPIRDQLQTALGPDFEVMTWSEIFPFLKSMMGTQDFIFSILFGVILSVVLLGIVNAMLMTVLERTREIGTMLAVGMKRRQVISLFLLEGAVQGIVGGIAGMLLGALVVFVLNRHGINLPAPGASVSAVLRPFVPLSFMIGVAVGAPLGASVACLWPAWRASRLRPVEALQSV